MILSLAVRDHWNVEAQPGAIRRIIMSLLDNSLKYTPSGNISISLEPRGQSDEFQLEFTIRVEDTGIGMSPEFQRDLSFAPFQQENKFEPGVGLGMSVTRRIVDSLHGSMVIDSKLHKGTSIAVGLSLPLHPKPCASIPNDLRQVVSRVKRKHLVLLDVRAADPSYQPSEATLRRENALRGVAENWFGMRVSKITLLNIEDADFFL